MSNDNDKKIYTDLELSLMAAIAGFHATLGPSADSYTSTVLEASRIPLTLEEIMVLWKPDGLANFHFGRTMANLCNNAIGIPMTDDPMGDIRKG